MTHDAKLGDIAKVIRSKNSGPFELTFNVMFDSPDVYWPVRYYVVAATDEIGLVPGS